MYRLKDNTQYLGTLQNAEGKNVLVEGQGGSASLATEIPMTGYNKAIAHAAVAPTDMVATSVGKLDYDMSQLYPLIVVTTVAEASNVFTLDLSLGLNFIITPNSVTGKTITLVNKPDSLTFAQPVSIKLVCTSGNVISTYPANIVWLTGMPTYVVGKTYYITLIPNGTGWHGSVLGGF